MPLWIAPGCLFVPLLGEEEKSSRRRVGSVSSIKDAIKDWAICGWDSLRNSYAARLELPSFWVFRINCTTSSLGRDGKPDFARIS